MDIQKILREIVIEDISLEEHSIMNVDTIVQQKIRLLDIQFKRRAMERVVSQYYYNHFNKLIMEEQVEDVLPLFKQIKCDINSVKDTSNFIFLNVNPAPNHSLLSFQQLIEKNLKKVWIKSYLYVLEQRGENLEELGKGFHTHIIIEKTETKQYTQALKELARSFSKCCDTSNYHLYNGSKIRAEDMEKRRNYILGRKADQTKWLKQDMDIIWRKEEFLKSSYGNLNIGLKKED